MIRRLLILLPVLALSISGQAASENREQRVRSDKPFVQQAGGWIYNDLNQGFTEARLTGKPLMVVLRCVP